MNHKNEIEVVLMPNGDILSIEECVGKILLNDNIMSVLYDLNDIAKLHHLGAKPMELLFISHEKIKQGDLKICLNDNSISKYLSNKSIESDTICHNCKKIIAVTNKSLNPVLYKDNEENFGFSGYYIWENDIVGRPKYLKLEDYKKLCLPEISSEFLKYFAEEYNKGNVIKNINVYSYNELYAKDKLKPENMLSISDNKNNLKQSYIDFACAVYNKNYLTDMSFKKRAEMMIHDFLND